MTSTAIFLLSCLNILKSINDSLKPLNLTWLFKKKGDDSYSATDVHNSFIQSLIASTNNSFTSQICKQKKMSTYKHLLFSMSWLLYFFLAVADHTVMVINLSGTKIFQVLKPCRGLVSFCFMYLVLCTKSENNKGPSGSTSVPKM